MHTCDQKHAVLTYLRVVFDRGHPKFRLVRSPDCFNIRKPLTSNQQPNHQDAEWAMRYRHAKAGNDTVDMLRRPTQREILCQRNQRHVLTHGLSRCT